jgi:O-antigen/teichoic acid export membrane protein
LKADSFLAKILWLFSGLLLAQLINTGFAFLLPRIYDPADFAHFGVFLATVLILFEVNNFKLDYALMLPSVEEESIALYKKAVYYSAVFAGVLMLIFFAYKLMPFREHADYLGWVPVSVFLNGIYQPTITWCNRHGKYALINSSRILQAIITGIIACAPIFIMTPHVLLIQGFVMGQLAALVVLMSMVISLLEAPTSVGNEVLMRYIQFPKFGTWSALLNTLSRNLVFYLLHFFFSPAQVGFYTFTNRLVQAPLGVVTGAIGQAYFRDASQSASAKDLQELTRKTMLSLSALAALPVVISLAWGPQLFGFLFGDAWEGAGEVARWLALWYGSSLVVTPLSMLVDVKGLLRWELRYNIAFFIIRLTALLIGGFSGHFLLTLGLFCAVGVVFNLYLLWFVNRLSHAES